MTWVTRASTAHVQRCESVGVPRRPEVRRRSGSTGAGLAAVGLLVGLLCPLLVAAPALASPRGAAVSGSVDASVIASDWWWSGEDTIGQSPQAPPADPSGVPAGDLGVSYAGASDGSPDKVAALAFDLRAVPASARFSRFTVVMDLDSSARQLAANQPALVACALTQTFDDAQGPGALSAAPGAATKGCAKGAIAKDGSSWTFELADIATAWAAGEPSYGVLVEPAPGASTLFSYAFLGKPGVHVTTAYTAPAAAPAQSAAPAPQASGLVPPPAPLSGGDSGGGAGTASSGGSGVAQSPDLGSSAPPPDRSAAGVPSTAVAPRATTSAAPSAGGSSSTGPGSGTGGPGASGTGASTASGVGPGSLRPTAGFWLGLLLLVALLLAASYVLGDPLGATPLRERPRAFIEIVRARTAAARSVAPPP